MIVETASGKVQGREKDGILDFRGIPYAASTAGEFRFQPPRPAEPWAGVRDATTFGPIAIQNQGTMEAMFGAPPQEMSEDALSLNIWTPAADDGKRPVMVWIHGGAFVSGTGATPWYDGRSFARDDIVVVTINYRLGALGFLYVDGQGNFGILDQVAALEWVRDNIAAFGGDPAKVTIFGESAGGMSVGTLLGLPAAKGLFGKAIPQSGAAHHVRSADEAERQTEAFLAELGIEASTPADAADRLRGISVEKLLEAQATMVAKGFNGGLAFMPVVDGVALPQQPIDAIGAGQSAGGKTMIGTTRDEFRLFTLLDPGLASLDDARVAKRIGTMLRDPGGGEKILTHYRSSHPDLSPAELWTDLATDLVFRIPAVRLAEVQAARGEDVYMYRFDWCTPAFGGQLGACHALEIPFVFESINSRGGEMFTGPVSEEMRAMSRAMHEAWASFARTGAPVSDGLPEWPRYTPDRRATMVFDLESSVEIDPGGADREAWSGLL